MTQDLEPLSQDPVERDEELLDLAELRRTDVPDRADFPVLDRNPDDAVVPDALSPLDLDGLDDSERPAADQAPRGARFLSQDEHVEGIAVLRSRRGDESEIRRIGHSARKD